jgi:hypothetical protein
MAGWERRGGAHPSRFSLEVSDQKSPADVGSKRSGDDFVAGFGVVKK